MKVVAGKKLPSRNERVDQNIQENQQFDTRTEQQKQTNAKPAKTPRTLLLSESSYSVLKELVSVTGLSERNILGNLMEQALTIMEPKLEIAKKMDMLPKIDISK